MGEPTELAAEHLRALDRLTARDELRRFYLAGGTAIAIHLRHRQSLDLDFFSIAPGTDLAPIKNAARETFSEARVLRESDASVHLLCDGTPIDFVSYPYPPIEPLAIGPSGVSLASPLDLAVMKLSAIARRGIRRDFWDLYALMASGIGLPAAADGYVRRFGVAEADLYHVLRALTYFDDAEKDPALPRGMRPEQWVAVKAFFLREAPTLIG